MWYAKGDYWIDAYLLCLNFIFVPVALRRVASDTVKEYLVGQPPNYQCMLLCTVNSAAYHFIIKSVLLSPPLWKSSRTSTPFSAYQGPDL